MISYYEGGMGKPTTRECVRTIFVGISSFGFSFPLQTLCVDDDPVGKNVTSAP